MVEVDITTKRNPLIPQAAVVSGRNKKTHYENLSYLKKIDEMVILVLGTDAGEELFE